MTRTYDKLGERERMALELKKFRESDDCHEVCLAGGLQELLLASFNSSGKFEVQISDQTSPSVIVHLNQSKNVTTLTAPVPDPSLTYSRVISVADATGFVAGAFVSVTNVAENRFYTGFVVSVNVLDVTLDSPLDFAYQIAGTVVTQGTVDMNVDGSVTPQVFSLRATDPGLPVVVDITRLMFECTTTGAVDLNKFGDIVGGILNGLVIRTTDGTYQNIFNFKDNADFAGVAYDFQVYSASNPVQGINGFTCRLTFAGQGKIGVALRVGPNEDIQSVVQDDLRQLVLLHIIAEGHVVVD